MQITAGHLRGRKLIAPSGRNIRPSASRTREAMFNLLLHAPPPEGTHSAIAGQRVADMCCGSGLLGFEAISRGAATALLVDEDKEAIALARANAKQLGISEQVTLLQASVARLPRCPQPFAAILADPPYGQGLAQPLLDAVLQGGWLMAGGYLALEIAASDPEPHAEGFTLYRDRAYGKARLLVYVTNATV